MQNDIAFVGDVKNVLGVPDGDPLPMKYSGLVAAHQQIRTGYLKHLGGGDVYLNRFGFGTVQDLLERPMNLDMDMVVFVQGHAVGADRNTIHDELAGVTRGFW